MFLKGPEGGVQEDRVRVPASLHSEPRSTKPTTYGILLSQLQPKRFNRDAGILASQYHDPSPTREQGVCGHESLLIIPGLFLWLTKQYKSHCFFFVCLFCRLPVWLHSSTIQFTRKCWTSISMTMPWRQLHCSRVPTGLIISECWVWLGINWQMWVLIFSCKSQLKNFSSHYILVSR